MMRLTKDEIAKIVSGKTKPTSEKITVIGAEYDSRQIKGGEIFIALKGEKEHGHHYIPTAYERGAGLLLVEDEAFLDSEYSDRVIVVADTLQAFWKLAEYWRLFLNIPTIAVTGSVGKTTTKEILASILMQKGAGNYAQKSFNNHVGVPYTLLKASPQHLWQVIEIGMNRPGEISSLSKITHPDLAMVTEVAAAHIGAFENIEGIGHEKLSIIDGARKGGSFVVNGDNEVIQNLLPSKNLDKDFTLLRVGENKSNDFIISDISVEGIDTIHFTVSDANHKNDNHWVLKALLRIAGVHNAKNAALAVVAAHTLFPDLLPEQIAKGLERFVAPLMRLNLKEIPGPGNKMMLDDSYNANPASMKAMLAIAADTKRVGKKIGLILGDMLELGAFNEEYHRALGEQVKELQPEFTFLVGQSSQIVQNAIGTSLKTAIFNTPEEAGNAATREAFDMIFIKASRGIGLDRAANAILTHAVSSVLKPS
jgi:UDP-N-acetylmuramoyl-tripeptide--D-alanyl-D-alanine ligase